VKVKCFCSGECIQQVDENVPAPTEFVRSIYEIYASKRNCCRLSVEGRSGLSLCHFV